MACHHSPLTANTMNDVKHGMPSTPLDSTHGQTTSGLTCHHRLWTAHTIERRRAWHAIIAFGQRRRLINSSGTGRKTSISEKREIGRHLAWHAITALGVAEIVRRRRASYAIIAVDGKHGQTTLGVACHHRLWTAHTVGNVGRGMKSPPLDSTHGQTTSSVA